MMFHALGYSVLLLLWACCNAQNDDCGPPPRRNNEELADLSGKQTYSHNEIILYNCRPGFIKLGRIKLRCNNGNWEQLPPLGKCKKRPCGHPGDIRFGSFELINEDEFVFGARVVYQCDSGFQMLSQTNYRDCRTDGWSHDVPHCEDSSCGNPPPIVNGGALNGTQGKYLPGTKVEYHCDEGFGISGISFSTCRNRSWTPMPTCQENPCDVPPQIFDALLHGQVKETYHPGETVHYVCHPRFIATGLLNVTCRKGEWTEPPNCEEIVCSRPVVNNGRVSPHQQQYSYEATIQIECDEGYKPEQRDGTSSCTATGWNPEPKCLSNRCGYPEAENVELYRNYEGYIDYYFPKREGDNIHFRCKNGFLPSDKQRSWVYSRCTKSGWNPVPKCFKHCEHKEGFPHGSFIAGYWSKFIEGNEISFTCQTGYDPEPKGKKTTCTKNGWSPTPRCISTEIHTCKRDSPLNGFFTDPKDQFALSERTRYRCQIGFTTQEGAEEGVTQCLSEGWTPKPECVNVTCPPPSEIAHGEITGQLKERYMPYDTVRYQCETGWNLSGPPEATCLKKQWTKLPRCVDAAGSCGRPPAIQNGDVLDTIRAFYPRGARLQYKCQNMYRMNGSSEVRCENGLWTEPPTCIEACTVSEGDMARNHIQLKWRSDVKLYLESGDMMEFTCNWGYRKDPRSPPFRVQCIEGKVVYPRCILD